ncbi:DUF4389 domain-containing protein [Streptosporangiaceae bacterium NEAU-GS5]|nr:DUF4389 domain-containing protein [Streptosporangiaceae bacterium NEAU-GS5]
MTQISYPVRVNARLDAPLSRGLWLVKWLLAIPHYLVLGVLWVAFSVLTVIAFFAILFTGAYPRAIFDFNVGVLRWTWRVAYYSYGALATDRYPPFTLGPAPDYPATLDVDYPVRLSRGLVLVKWWLLAIPHYVIVGLFTSGSLLAWRGSGAARALVVTWGGGLVGLLVCVAALVLLFTGRYPRGVFDFVLGMNRWALRVAAYATLMTDVYPPFRLDTGGQEPLGTDPSGTPPPVPSQRSWPLAAVVSVVVGALLTVSALGTGAAATGATWLNSNRDPAGYISTDTQAVDTSAYALTLENVRISTFASGLVRDAVGHIRVQVTGTGKPLFAGIAAQRDATAYLRHIAYDQITQLPPAGPDVRYHRYPGGATELAPGGQTFWTAKASGAGTQTLTWTVEPGRWALVVMNADGSAAVSADLTVAAEAPGLGGLAAVLFVVTAVLLVAGACLMVLGVRQASGGAAGTRRPAPPPVPDPHTPSGIPA